MNRYHTFFPRVLAGVIDFLVLLPISVLDDLVTEAEPSAFVVTLWQIVSFSSLWIYSVLLHARYGKTLGKMVAKVTVLDRSEERLPTLRQAVLRDIGYLVPNGIALTYTIYWNLFGRFLPDSEWSEWPSRTAHAVSRRDGGGPTAWLRLSSSTTLRAMAWRMPSSLA